MQTLPEKSQRTRDTLRVFLRPALFVMNRLRYPQKFAVISLLFALPLGFVLYLLLSEINDRIAFAHKEILGTQYLRPLRGLLEHVPQSRILAFDYANGQVSVRPELIRQQAKIDANMESLADVEQKLGQVLKTTSKYAVLKENRRFLKEMLLSLPPPQSDALHLQLLADIRALIAHVGDTSNLILDPDLDSYYLMDAVLLKLPEAADLSGQLRMHGQKSLAADQTLTAEEKAELIRLTGLLRSNLEATRSSFDVAFHNNPANNLKPQLDGALQEYLRTANAFLETLDRSIITAQTITLPPDLYDRLAREHLEASGSFWDRTVVELDGLLRARIDRFAWKKTLVALVVILALLVVLYLWVAFYLAVMRTVVHLENAAQRMVRGDMAEIVRLETQDELGQVVTSFNTIALRLRQEWVQAQEESARASAAETLLRENEARLRLIIDTALDAVIVMDAQSVIAGWNPQATAIFGWSQEEAIGRPLTDTIIPPHYREAHARGVQRFLATGEGPVLNTRIEITALHRDGHEFPVELAIAPATTGGQHTFSAFVRDITARKRAEEELRQAKEAAEVANQAKSEFLANMSHELRTPLNAIIGFSEVLLDKMFGELNARQEDYLQDILSSGQYLLSLINDILDLAKVETGKMELNLSIFDLRQVLEGSLVMVKERALVHGVSLSLEMDHTLSSLLGDERKVKQVLFNLLSNAVKFTPNGGKVGIRARTVDGAVEVAVWDTGVGMAEEDQERIFTAFQQIEQANEGKTEGTGLGLTLTKQLIALHGGSIWVDSTPGQGSTFTFMLPLTRATAEPMLPVLSVAEPPAQEVDTSTSSVILVIEDDPRAADLLRIYLSEAGYRLDMAQNGAEGLEKIAQRRPEAVILDVLLPQMDGWTFLTQMKANATTKDIPVIVVSIVDQKEKGFALGAAEYLVKPIQKDTLLSMLCAFGLRSSV
jgi:PAS domain S-box-containing protein